MKKEDLAQAEKILNKWSSRIESRLTGENKARKRSSNHLQTVEEKGHARTAMNQATFSENVQGSGKRLRMQENLLVPKKIEVPTSKFHQLDRQPPILDCWHKQENSWEIILKKFEIPKNRYVDFEFVKYLKIDDPYIMNYIKFQLEIEKPKIVGRLRHCLPFWKYLNAPESS